MNTKALRQKVLDLAIHGKLVPQNPNDESATVLLEKIRAEKAEKIKKGELKADKKDSFIFVGSDKRHYEQFADGTVKDIEDEIPFEVPEGWAWCRLGEICDYGKCINVNASELQPNDWILDLEDIEKDSGKILAYYNLADRKSESTKHKFYKGQVLYSKLRPYLNKVVIAPKDGFCTSEILPLDFKGKVFSKYAQALLMSPYFLEMVNMVTYGVKMPRLGTDDAKKMIIPLPPYEEQLCIVAAIENIFSQIDDIDENKYDLQTAIKQAKSKILDLAIHGKLVPQDSNDEPAEELLKRIATSDNRPYEKVEEEPFKIPDSWKWIKLSSICNKLVDGDHNPPKGIEEKTEYIMASSRNINYDRLDDLENVRYLTKEVFEIENNRTKAEKGDLFFTSVGTLGRSCIYSGDYNICFQRSVTVLNTNINNQFLKYFFDSNFFQTYIIEHSTGTAQMGFYLKEMANSPIAIPPLNEQSRIVDKVSELFYQLDQIQNNLV